MSWIADHSILLAGFVLIALVVIGIVLLVIRGLDLFRRVKASKTTVDPHVATLTQSIGQAETRMGAITEGQQELSGTLDRVSTQTAYLGRLVSVATGALAVLRAPLKFLGR